MRSSEVLEGAHQCHFLFKLYLDQYKTLISVYLFNNFKESGYFEILLYNTNSKNSYSTKTKCHFIHTPIEGLLY